LGEDIRLYSALYVQFGLDLAPQKDQIPAVPEGLGLERRIQDWQ
jgi:hypothetical protein